MLKSKIHNLFVILAILTYLTGCEETLTPSISLTASPEIVSENGSTTLSWSSTGVTNCTASGDWSGSKELAGTETIRSITQDSVFTLSCTGDNGSVETFVKVKIDNPSAPTINLSANPTSVSLNGSTTLNWSSTDTDSCTASGSWSGSKPTSGSETINSLTNNSTFSLSCTGANGSSSDSISITVSAPSVPTVNLTATPTSVSYNGSTILNWSSNNADSCRASGGWTGTKPSSGSETISSLTDSSTFTLSCSGGNAAVNDSVTVTVAPPPTPTVNLSADPTTISHNSSTTLSWNSENADSCRASGDWSGIKNSAGSETINSLTQNSTFNLVCTGNGGSATNSVSVTVEAPVTLSVNLAADPTSVPPNGSTTLSWQSSNADSCTASGDWSGTKDTSGTETINSLTSDSQFILSCSNATDSLSSTADVTIITSNNGTALLSWTPPTENTDGSALTDLAGYKIYYGTSSGNYTYTITIDNPGISSYLVEGLAPGVWYFVMTSFNTQGIESSHSGEGSKTID